MDLGNTNRCIVFYQLRLVVNELELKVINTATKIETKFWFKILFEVMNDIAPKNMSQKIVKITNSI